MENDIITLNNRLDNLENSSSIPREVETAFRERLAFPIILSGTAPLVSGSLVIKNPRIGITSVAISTSQSSNSTTSTSANTLAAICTNGVATFFITGSTSTEVINYLIIL